MGMDSHFFESTGSSTVEIFAYRDGRLYHRETVAGPELSSPNDILAVGPRQFYVSIDHGATSVLGKKLENYLQLPISYILYYDGKGFRKAAGGIAYANGIAISPDGATLYVGATVGRKVHVYSRDARTGELTARESVPLGTGVDNLDVTRTVRYGPDVTRSFFRSSAHSKDAGEALAIGGDAHTAAGERGIRCRPGLPETEASFRARARPSRGRTGCSWEPCTTSVFLTVCFCRAKARSKPGGERTYTIVRTVEARGVPAESNAIKGE